MTNFHDIVPHLPPEDFSFYHVSTEIWEQQNTYTVCQGGEDRMLPAFYVVYDCSEFCYVCCLAHCADSVSPLDYSIEDHLHYMGVPCCEGPDDSASGSKG